MTAWWCALDTTSLTAWWCALDTTSLGVWWCALDTTSSGGAALGRQENPSRTSIGMGSTPSDQSHSQPRARKREEMERGGLKKIFNNSPLNILGCTLGRWYSGGSC